MRKQNSELLQVVAFLVICLGNLFLFFRYMYREDMIGAFIFILVVVLSGIAAFGHLLAWREVRK